MGAVGDAIGGAVNTVVDSVKDPFVDTANSIKKVVTDPEHANLGDFTSTLFPVAGSVIKDEINNPSHAVAHAALLGAAFGGQALLAGGSGGSAAAGGYNADGIWEGARPAAGGGGSWFSGLQGSGDRLFNGVANLFGGGAKTATLAELDGAGAEGAFGSAADFDGGIASKGAASGGFLSGLPSASGLLSTVTNLAVVKSLLGSAQKAGVIPGGGQTDARRDAVTILNGRPDSVGGLQQQPIFASAGGLVMAVLIPGGVIALAYWWWKHRRKH